MDRRFCGLSSRSVEALPHTYWSVSRPFNRTNTSISFFCAQWFPLARVIAPTPIVRMFEATAACAWTAKSVNFTDGPRVECAQLINGHRRLGCESQFPGKCKTNGSTLHLYDGARRKGRGSQLRGSRANTVLEFDFKADGTLGDLYGIGVSNDLNALTTPKFLRLPVRFADNWLSRVDLEIQEQ